MTFPTGWTKRSTLTIPAAQVGSGGVSSFTVLLTQASINAASKTDLFANAKNDGSDLRVSTDAAGTNPLTVDVIAYDDTAETFVIRVGTLALSATVDNTLYLWWGNAAASAQTGSAAYDADWAGYWPAAGGSDQTVNANSAAGVGGVSIGAVTGPYGGPATDFDGSNDVAQITPDLLAGEASVAVMAWAKPDTQASDQRLLSRWPLNDQFILWRDVGGSGIGWAFIVNNSIRAGEDTASGSVGSWQHVAGRYSASSIDVAVDGSIVASGSGGGVLDTSTSRTKIGGVNTDYFDGSIAEVQLHTSARSAAWIATEFNQTSAPASFASSGDPVAVGGAPSVRRRSRWSA